MKVCSVWGNDINDKIWAQEHANEGPLTASETFSAADNVLGLQRKKL